jgi:hypothetical protein
MEYTREQIDAAFLQDEVARYSLLATSGPQRPQYGELELAAGVPEEPADSLTFEDVDAAVAELAMARGEDYSTTYEQVRSLTGGERDLVSLTAGIVELATGSSSADEGDHVKDLASRHPEFFGKEEEEDEGRETKARKRRRKATTPESLNVGTEAASGDVEAAARRWARTGVVSLSEDGDDELLELATDDGEGGAVEDVLSRYPELFQPGLQRPSARRQRPARASFRPGPVGTASRAHSTDTDPSDRRQPHRGGETHPEVDRYLGMLHSSGFGGAEKPSGSIVTHRRRAG